jgi:uroporphyrin-III C-methyltransferase/precorrin-2 dehydrogenase/sirohydrochlorin ferrochelatase
MTEPRRPRVTEGAGLAPLAVLPLFLKLEGRRAVVAGHHPGAPWKIRLLAAAGAAVAVFDPEPDDEVREAAACAANGRVSLQARAWREEDLAGAAFAVAAFAEDAEAERFVAAARGAGAIVNAIDRPHLCDVQFGAIVNRSPLVVGISTDGAAPVVGQAIRSAVEGLLPAGIGAWLDAAKAWRGRVAARVKTFAERRRAWERFADAALAEPERRPTEEDLDAILRGAPAGGSVALVGAGPGDPELLTLRAVRALRTADVILYDDLVAPGVLDFARREARTMRVGKTGHGPSCRQDDICRLMVALAREGRRVVRLKGGDPLVFGRANEEIDACRAAGVPVSVVSGITSAVAAAARLSVSLTDRGTARRVQFVTGHDRAGGLPPDLHWDALVDPAASTAVYMPRRTAGELLRALMARGLPAATPAVAVASLSRPDERIVAGTAATIAAQVEEGAAAGPLLLLLGQAFRRAAAAADGPALSAPAARATG